MKKLFALCMVLASLSVYAQEKKEKPKSNWSKKGVFTVLFNQSSFSNWIAGGENAVSGTVSINYDFNYKSGDWTWDNKLITKYGISNISGTGSRKTDDILELNSLIGLKASNNWSYSFFTNIRTQFTDGFDYSTSPKTKTSGFFAPGYLTFGPGIVYKKSENFNLNLSPLTSKATFVSNDFAGAYGTDPGKTSRYEVGFYAALYYKTSLMKNVSMENIMNFYSNYLEEVQNIDVNYQMNLVMQVNKYLSTNLNFHMIIDDNASSKVQFKEVFGVGVNYIF